MLIAAGAKPINSYAGSLEAAAARSLMPKFGIALFDNPRDMSAGWACRADEAPFKFTSSFELSNDTIWVSSLKLAEHKKKAERLGNIKQIGYLRSSLITIAGDLGLNIAASNAMNSSEILAKLFNQTMLIAINTYRWKSPANELRGETLTDDIRRMLPHAPKPPSHIRSALTGAYQSYSSPEWADEWEPESFMITLRYNRVEYAEKIMTTIVPDEVWTYIPPEQLNGMSINDLLNPNQPSLVEAVVDFRGIDPDIANLISFGVEPSVRSGLRKWISQPELSWLSRHANVRVSSALISRSARTLPDGIGLPGNLTSDPLYSLAISAGLVAESHWNAIATPAYNKSQRCIEMNTWTVWLRAVDRALSFSLALKAYHAGFKVKSYGNGSIQIKTTKDKLMACLEFADENEVFHPAFSEIFKTYGIEDELT